jgi:hypothetical protein
VTAEIAIINRSAVTLATDSAVTLTVRGAEKIYNGADKLFELSVRDPIGIMVYNNLEFMGMSLEVAIKQFREKVATRNYDSVLDAANAFFSYLERNLAPDAVLQQQHAKAIIYPLFTEVRREFRDSATQIFQKAKHRTDFDAIFSQTVAEYVANAEMHPRSNCFGSLSEAELLKLYLDSIDELVEEFFRQWPLREDHKDQLRHLAVLHLQRDIYSEFATGIVFAGFGEKEMFPALFSYQIDGIIADRLKKRERERVVTNRTEVSGEILPFAQREMVDRFLYGIDPEFESGIEEYLGAALTSTGDVLIRKLPRLKKATKDKLNREAKAASTAALKVWREKMVPNVKTKFKQDVQDMVFLMPKQELAILAQELINLTSVKRKFSSGRESVGGPIDVAVISRIDGFVWVRRKHYFEANLNPRYFHRKYGGVPQGDGA